MRQNLNQLLRINVFTKGHVEIMSLQIITPLLDIQKNILILRKQTLKLWGKVIQSMYSTLKWLKK